MLQMLACTLISWLRGMPDSFAELLQVKSVVPSVQNVQISLMAVTNIMILLSKYHTCKMIEGINQGCITCQCGQHTWSQQVIQQLICSTLTH